MIELQGKYNTAKVFTDNIEKEAISQIIGLCNQEVFAGGKIRIMPDVHYGKSCVIGFTADLGDKVIPNIVGVDIGCGMHVVELGNLDMILEKVDRIVRTYIPSGYNVNEHPLVDWMDKIREIKCLKEICDKNADINRFNSAIGSLGGGNHFIEINQDSQGNKFLVIHSGSRNLGKRVADYYQNLAVQLHSGKDYLLKERDNIIRDYKEQGKEHLIQDRIKKLNIDFNEKKPKIPKELCYLTGKYRDDYLHDMRICQEYAQLSRETMANEILRMYFENDVRINCYVENSTHDTKQYDFRAFHTIHNYIDCEDNIIRKGSVSAKQGEKLIIPINMRDGSIIAIGKGNEDWNNSAPHGAGRLMSRSKAKQLINMDEYEDSMRGIYSNSVNESTLDEAPMAYKPIDEIMNNIQDAVDVVDIIKPIYNFKA